MKKTIVPIIAMSCILNMANAMPSQQEVQANLANMQINHSKVNDAIAQETIDSYDGDILQQYSNSVAHKRHHHCYGNCHSDCQTGAWF